MSNIEMKERRLRLSVDKLDDFGFRGSFNSLTPGKRFKNPDFIFRVSHSSLFFGDGDATKVHLARLVSLVRDVPIGEIDAYVVKNNPVVYLYLANKKKLIRRSFKGLSSTNWKQLDEVIIK